MAKCRFALLILSSWMMHAATLRYWIEPCSRPETGCRVDDTELAQWAMEAWQAAAHEKLILQRTGEREHAHIRLYWASGPEGAYEETHPILVDGQRGAEIYVAPTVVSRAETDRILRDAIVYLTCLHETGHALGLDHTADFDDIMYSFQYGGDITEYFGRYRRQLHSRSDIREHPGISEHARNRLREIFH